jgi:mannonate dehydratase
MGLEQTWRWFGPADPVTLREIRQTGATGVVTALHHVPVGETWSVEEIKFRRSLIEAEGLRWSVAESLPVHEEIKTRSGGHSRWIRNYKQSLNNLGRCGVRVVCYNFMPVLDWLRTDLRVVCEDGGITTRYDADVFAAFDLFILKRPGAELDHAGDGAVRAARVYERMSEAQRDELTRTVLLGLPGSLEAYSLEGLRAAIIRYEGIGIPELRQNLLEFLREVVPAAEEAGVSLAIHADDPPWPVLGLPRVVTDADDLERILSVSASPAHGITFCTGSFGAKASNDLVGMARRFASRISFAHLRNVSRNDRGDFREEDHLDGDVDMAGLMRVLVLEQNRREEEGGRRIPFRPDHGRLLAPDMGHEGIYPGYSLFGRMRGLAELRGLELGIRASLGR